MKEKLDCETSLIASACGEEVASFYDSLAKVDQRKHKCYMMRENQSHTSEGELATPKLDL